MSIKLVETSLNLRKEKGKTNMDYTLSEKIAEKQLEFDADVYANVEFMDCHNEGYLNRFKDAGYKLYSFTDHNHRGNLCAIKKEYDAKVISTMEAPHFMHIEITREDKKMDLFIARILVAGGGDEDFKSRREQWGRIVCYINSLENRENIVLTGDFNNGVISEEYKSDSPRRFYNYQMIVKELKETDVKLFEMEGCSFKNDMKIDHIATGTNIEVLNAAYIPAFRGKTAIGIPDHNCIAAEIEHIN